jgi:phosphatidylserine/phosphatidylglycerophosphate/cardiolipin synthase-like enzyme
LELSFNYRPRQAEGELSEAGVTRPWEHACLLAHAVAAAAVLSVGVPSAYAGDYLELHWSPTENLERIDAELLSQAQRTIDMSAYVLSDFELIEAIERRATAGVQVRLYLDNEQLEELLKRARSEHPLEALARSPNVQVKVKRSRVLMHLKAYAIDGALLRAGSANFSPSGEKQQDNELSILRDREAAKQFLADFDAMWSRLDNIVWRGRAL